MKARLSLAVLAIVAATLSGCGRKHDDFASLPLTPLPPIPAWAAPMLGTDAEKGFAKSLDCQGAFDALYNHHRTEPTGAEANGWGWLTTAHVAPTQILLADGSGKIIGAGQVDYDRADVPKALAEVTSIRVGWHAVMNDPAGQVTAFALMPNNTLCRLGSKES